MSKKKIVLFFLCMTMIGLLSAQNSKEQKKPYLVVDFAGDELDMMLDICHKGGFERLVQSKPFSSFGHYEWNEEFARDGEKSVVRMVKTAKNAGVNLGVLVQSDAISVDDPFFAPKYFKHLKRQGEVELYDEIDADTRDIVLRRNDVMKAPSTLNLILIEDEMIIYGTMEFAGEMVLLHRCTRGAYGTKKVPHNVDAEAYKIWDSPERYVEPDDYLRGLVRQELTEKLNGVGINFVLYKGDEGQEILDESIRVRQVERWENDGVKNGSLGWFLLRTADKKRKNTTMEDLEWMLSKAASFNAGYGMVIDAKVITDYSMFDDMLEAMKQWNQLIKKDAFTASQKELMKDPYIDWHLEEQDGTFMLYPIDLSRRYQCNFTEDEPGLLTTEKWEWTSEKEERFGLRIFVEGEKEIRNPMINTEKGLVLFPCTIRPGQTLVYDFKDVAYVVDANHKVLEETTIEGISVLPEGSSEVYLICEVDPGEERPVVTVRYIIREEPEEIHPKK